MSSLAPEFFTEFSARIIQAVLNLRAEDHLSITLLVIVAATLCEQEDMNPDVAQRLLQTFSGYLALTTRKLKCYINH